MTDRNLILIGYSGHGFVVADAAREAGLPLGGYADKQKAEENPFSLDYAGYETNPDFDQWNMKRGFIMGIGNNIRRWRSARFLIEHNGEIWNVIHPDASVSSTLRMGQGNFINRGALVNAQSVIGDVCIINTGAILEHDCRLGNAVHLAPGAVLAGGVTVGDCSFVGANAVIREGVRIGANVTIGAGSVVLRDVMDNEKIVGNPGRSI